MDPYSGAQVSILANMAYFVAMLLFLIMNGHHMVLSAVKESFEIIQVGSLGLNKGVFEKLVTLYGSMFIIAVKIGAPAIAALLFVKVAFGLITKLIPQMNIMIVAFPVQIVIGLLFFGLTMNILLGFTFCGGFERSPNQDHDMVKGLKDAGREFRRENRTTNSQEEKGGQGQRGSGQE
jgi:flagellar biosynthetic protein FliR